MDMKRERDQTRIDQAKQGALPLTPAQRARFNALDHLIENKPVLLANVRNWATGNSTTAKQVTNKLIADFRGLQTHKTSGGTALVFAPFAAAVAAAGAVAARAAELDVCFPAMLQSASAYAACACPLLISCNPKIPPPLHAGVYGVRVGGLGGVAWGARPIPLGGITWRFREKKACRRACGRPSASAAATLESPKRTTEWPWQPRGGPGRGGPRDRA